MSWLCLGDFILLHSLLLWCKGTPCLGAAETSARLEKHLRGEPVGNPKHTHPDAGQQQSELSAERMGWWEGELCLAAGAWGWSRVLFLSIAPQRLHAFLQLCGALCGTL